MPYINWQPDNALQNHIKCYWYAERLFAPNDSFAILPDSFIELVFCFSENAIVYSDGKSSRTLPPAFVIGLLDKPLHISTTGTLRTFGIRFFPWAYYHLIRKAPDSHILPIPVEFRSLHDQPAGISPNPLSLT